MFWNDIRLLLAISDQVLILVTAPSSSIVTSQLVTAHGQVGVPFQAFASIPAMAQVHANAQDMSVTQNAK